jgi:hypothetical protein
MGLYLPPSKSYYYSAHNKSLLPFPAYRQAGFTKGKNYPSLAKRGEGRFSDAPVFFVMDC